MQLVMSFPEKQKSLVHAQDTRYKGRNYNSMGRFPFSMGNFGVTLCPFSVGPFTIDCATRGCPFSAGTYTGLLVRRFSWGRTSGLRSSVSSGCV